MKKDPLIRNAIDESLGSVHFSQQDMRAVLKAVRQSCAPQRSARRTKRPHAQWALAAAMLVLVAAPLGLLTANALRAGTTDITTIAAAPGESLSPSFEPNRDVVLEATPIPALIPESDAIRAARTCFEAQCDTSVFTFEEYTVSASIADSGAEYVVLMQSIYDNGCSFRVIISALDGSVIAHSAPDLATVPALLDESSAEVQAWYAKHGAHVFMWPLDIQAEFSRRYSGSALRMPNEREVNADVILLAAEKDFASYAPDRLPSAPFAAYVTLYDGSMFADGRARYQVYCFAGEGKGGTLPEECIILTYLAGDGAFESSQIVSTSGL